MVDIKEIEMEIIREVGLGVDINDCLVDQDSGMYIEVADKRIKYGVDKFVSIDRNTEIFFNPLKNLKLILNLFSLHLTKICLYNNMVVHSYNVDKDEDSRHIITIHTSNGVYYSRGYKKLLLSYIDMIFILGGGDTIDLTELDYA